MYGGTRDVDWTHIRVEGNRAAAASYVPAARLLLGAAKQTFESTGVSQLFRRRFSDGVEIRATYNAKTPVVTIRVPTPTGRRRRPPLFDGYYLEPTYESALFGLPGFGAVVDTSAEFTYFYKAQQPQWGRITGGKLTYRERDGVTLYPDGMGTRATTYWMSPSGTAIAWASPTREHGYLEFTTSRLRVVASGNPNWGYSTFSRSIPRWGVPTVANMGVPLFAPDTYRDENGSLVGADGYPGVAGAGLQRGNDGLWLYLAQYAAGASHEEDGGVRIARYRLRPRAEGQSFLGAVVNGSREWVGDPVALDGVWNLVTDVRFNASCTEALFVLQPSAQTLGDFAAPDPVWTAGPHLRVRRMRLADGAFTDINNGDTFSVTGDFTAGAIAVDCFHAYRSDALVSYRLTLSGSHANIRSTLTTPTGFDIPLYHITDIGGFTAPGMPPGAGVFYAKYVAKTVHYVDAANGYVVLCGVDNTNAPVSYRTWIEVWREELDPTRPPGITKVHETAPFVVPLNPFPPVQPVGAATPPTIGTHWSGFDPNTRGFIMGGANANVGLYSWSLLRRLFTTPHGRIPYDWNLGFQYGLSSDAVTGLFMKWNVFNTFVIGSFTPASRLAGVGEVGAFHRNAHTRFCAYKDTWLLFTYVPGTSDRRLVIASNGVNVKGLLGADGDEEVATGSAILPFGRPIFNPSN
ncbi:MAG: hypothetical protein DDT39_00050 [Firmicutes bacterium]|nr:hypothetical protein [candidate division NPL-UPA2 bacterium]